MVRKIKPVSRQVKIQTEVARIERDRVVAADAVPRLDEFWQPAVDIFEKPGEIVVEAEMPGVSQDDVTITVQSNRVEIKGVKNESLPAGKAHYLRLEREFGRFRRLIVLPCTVVPDRARAFLGHGVLVIQLIKYQPAEAAAIDIQPPKDEE